MTASGPSPDNAPRNTAIPRSAPLLWAVAQEFAVLAGGRARDHLESARRLLGDVLGEGPGHHADMPTALAG